MSNECLIDKLTKDLVSLKLPVNEVDLFLRPYSSTFYGRYFPVFNEANTRPKIYIYPFLNKKGVLDSYDTILCTAIHEMVHHIQYTSGSFIRLANVAHNPEFWRLYNRYVKRAIKLKLIKKEVLSDNA